MLIPVLSSLSVLEAATGLHLRTRPLPHMRDTLGAARPYFNMVIHATVIGPPPPPPSCSCPLCSPAVPAAILLDAREPQSMPTATCHRTTARPMTPATIMP